MIRSVSGHRAWVLIAAPALAAAGVSGLWIWLRPAASPWSGAVVVSLAALAGSWIALRLLGPAPADPSGNDRTDPFLRLDSDGHTVSEQTLRDLSTPSVGEAGEVGVGLGEQEHFAYNLIDTAQVIVLVLDTQGRILLINRFMEELSGYPFQEIKGEDWFSTFLPERDRGRTRRLFLKAVNNIRTGGHVSTILTRSGEQREIEWHSRTLKGSDGGTVGLLSIGVDVTERRKAEEALRRSEERYRAIVQNQSELISRYTPDGTLTFVNDAYARYFGESPSQLLGSKFWHHVPPEHQPTLKEHIASLGASHLLASIEHPVLTPKGLHWQQWTDRVILGADGEVVEILAVGRDITARKEAELALERERARLYSLLDGLPAFVYLHGRDHVVRFANRAFRDAFGAGEGRRCHEVLRDLDAPCEDCRTSLVLDTQSPHRSECTLLKTGRSYQIFSYPFMDVDGTPLALELWIDDSEQKENERALRQSEAALRSLSARLLKAQEEERKRIAVELHDSIGSSLTGIKLFLQNVLDRLQRGEPAESAVEHLLSLTQDTIEESRRIMTDLRPSILDDLGLIKTIQWFCREYRRINPAVFIEESIEIEEENIPDDLKIVIFRVMQEAFHNIAKHSGAEYVTVDFRKQVGRIHFAVKDNGDGFDVGGGTFPRQGSQGLGLSGMKERTELSGGELQIHSIPGLGTEVRASWPADSP